MKYADALAWPLWQTAARRETLKQTSKQCSSDDVLEGKQGTYRVV